MRVMDSCGLHAPFSFLFVFQPLVMLSVGHRHRNVALKIIPCCFSISSAAPLPRPVSFARHRPLEPDACARGGISPLPHACGAPSDGLRAIPRVLCPYAVNCIEVPEMSNCDSTTPALF